MVMEMLGSGVIGGMIGYAIGKDGKVHPVTQEQVNKWLRTAKPEIIKKLSIDTSVAHTGVVGDGEYDIAGSFILVLNPDTPSTTIYIKFNEPDAPELPLTSLRRVRGPFYRFFIKNDAGSGTLNLIVAKGYQFEFIEGQVISSVGHASTHEDGGTDEISVAGLSGLLADDQHVLDAEVLAVAAALVHASRHQNGGADEISVAGLSGLLADDQHVLDAEVLAVAAALVHASRHQNGGADEISVTGLSGLLADDQHVLDAEAVAAAEAAGLALASGKNIKLISALTSDHTWSGVTAVLTAGTALTIGQAVYVGSDGKMEKTDADAAATMPVVALATGTISENATGEFLLLGFMRDDTWNWTPGGLLYASTTLGALTQTAPSGSGDQVQVIGKALTADIIYLNPSLELVEIT